MLIICGRLPGTVIGMAGTWRNRPAVIAGMAKARVHDLIIVVADTRVQGHSSRTDWTNDLAELINAASAMP